MASLTHTNVLELLRKNLFHVKFIEFVEKNKKIGEFLSFIDSEDCFKKSFAVCFDGFDDCIKMNMLGRIYSKFESLTFESLSHKDGGMMKNFVFISKNLSIEMESILSKYADNIWNRAKSMRNGNEFKETSSAAFQSSTQPPTQLNSDVKLEELPLSSMIEDKTGRDSTVVTKFAEIPGVTKLAVSPLEDKRDLAGVTELADISGVTKVAEFSLTPMIEDNTGQDLIGVTKIAASLAEFIGQNNTPLVIGLFAPWGAGKSFFMAKVRLIFRFVSC